ncbi:LOW QUALITY PROTEIN: ubinuclein-1-like [Uloborus diversus]|uniref:LOW QUALITY PROTEIN: ubinuclein-1-like n=1 Tax=Uloborus diversus TaxID=327109 RepID=UPI00240918E8|nr:LOW QUALITY PROTEIN: ubinuclein-1-like [Uloborus diversus]
MAEPKRIQLDAPKTLQREKKVKTLPPTFRFDLKLTDTKNNTVNAEFSYAELVKEARTSDSKLKHHGNDDPFLDDESHERLQEMARKLEEKYNPKPGRKRKKKFVEHEDYVDKGIGYDETDPFIDNEEAYDELVPSTLTTQFGGFYINKGDLEFRNLDESTNDVKTRKKRMKQGPDKDLRRKRKIGFEENHKRRGRRPLSESMSALPKTKKKSQPTVADMLQQHKANLQRLQQEGLQQLQLNPIAVEREIEQEEAEENLEQQQPQQQPQQQQQQIVPGQASTISEAIESVIKAAAEDASNGSIGPITGSSDGEEAKLTVDMHEAPKLPENLPPDLDEVVAKLKEAAYKSEEGKCKFFSDEVNRMLLSVELKAQALTSAQRSTIYSHLASHLPCTKETLQKRAKKLRLDQEDGKLKEPMQRLKDGISAVMPAMLEKYSAALNACDAKEEERKVNPSTNGSDAEESQDGSERKASRLPKKHFEWNETIRKYLCDVVRIKLKCYEVSKTRIQSAEEYLKHFLEAEVKNLWPPGWMQSRILFRESRAAHFYITNRPKKQILVTKKLTTPAAPVMLTMKPAVSLLNNTLLSQDSDFDQMFQEKCVPLIPSVENAMERRENADVLHSNNVVSAEESAAEFAKLFTLPIKSNVPEDASPTKTQESVNVHATKVIVDQPPPKTPSPHLNLSQQKSEKHSKSQNKQSYASKISDFNTYTEGSLASDMLARIICASLADFPYAGSNNIENSAAKTTSVISANPSIIKESRTVNSKFPNDVLTSPKLLDSVKPLNTEARKPSQETGLHKFSSIGINIESLLSPKSQTIARQSDGNNLIKNKGLPEATNIVNLKLKDSIVPHSKQFAEAFERTADTPPVSKKHLKNLNYHSQSLALSASASSRLYNTNEHVNDYPSSTSPRSTLDNSQKMAFDFVKYNSSVTSQGNVSAPYKKRSKYAQSVKVTEQWNHLYDSGLLEGMKGFPFPVNSLPTPPPAHSSSPLRTVAHSQHNSSRTSSHISPGLRSLHEPKTDSSNHSSQANSNILSIADVQRRQSLIQGPWKSNSQSPATSLSHFMASTSPPVSNQSKSTSPNHHSSNSHVNLSPVPAHSMTQIEKVPSAYSRSHSPLPPRASPSHMSTLGHGTKTSPSSTYSHLGQPSYTTHQSSHNVSPALHHQTHIRSSNAYDPPSASPTTSSGTYTLSPVPECPTKSPLNLFEEKVGLPFVFLVGSHVMVISERMKNLQRVNSQVDDDHVKLRLG